MAGGLAHQAALGAARSRSQTRSLAEINAAPMVIHAAPTSTTVAPIARPAAPTAMHEAPISITTGLVKPLAAS